MPVAVAGHPTIPTKPFQGGDPLFLGGCSPVTPVSSAGPKGHVRDTPTATSSPGASRGAPRTMPRAHLVGCRVLAVQGRHRQPALGVHLGLPTLQMRQERT